MCTINQLSSLQEINNSWLEDEKMQDPIVMTSLNEDGKWQTHSNKNTIMVDGIENGSMNYESKLFAITNNSNISLTIILLPSTKDISTIFMLDYYTNRKNKIMY